MQDSDESVLFTLTNFLTEYKNADAVYILGDLFNYWLGDDHQTSFTRAVAHLFQQASQQGLSFYFMQGNRDFLLGKQFAKMCEFTLLPDPSVINLYGNRVLLMHGDSLCTFDRLHQFWFQLTRHHYNQQIATCIPLSWRQYLAEYLRQRSQKHQRQVQPQHLDVNPEHVTKIMQKYSVSLLIHGHTHQPGIHLGENPTKPQNSRIVLGAWHETASVLFFYENGDYELKNIPILNKI